MKLPNDLNGIELAKQLQRLGYAVTRQIGSHMRLTRQGPQGRQHITIPAHKPLRVGRLRQILKDVSSQCLIELGDLFDQLEGLAMERITYNPHQCGGKTCVRGMRIRMADMLELNAAGLSSAQILADYPDLETEDLEAALRYAAREVDHPVHVA